MLFHGCFADYKSRYATIENEKKSQKTPKQEIDLAKIYRADYYARKEKK